jgi:hypothetical protein
VAPPQQFQIPMYNPPPQFTVPHYNPPPMPHFP